MKSFLKEEGIYEDVVAAASKRVLAWQMQQAMKKNRVTKSELAKRMKTRLQPITPGEILLEEFMKPNDLSQNQLARDLDLNPARVHDIVRGKSGITANIALRLAKFFGTTPELWLNLQSDYDLRRAKSETWPKIEGRVRVLAAE